MQEKYTWLEAGESLARETEYWLQSEYIVLDTEFIRTRTFYPVPGLIQVADDRQVWLIDPQKPGYESSLKALLESDSVIKVLHACSEDLEVFSHSIGAGFSQLLDTQIASAMLGDGLSLGYASLVSRWLDIEMDKGETRSDWLQRPLTDAQIGYAVKDVWYLHKIYPAVRDALISAGRFSWALEDTARLAESVTAEDQDANSYLKLRQGWQLKGRRLWLLQALAAWREKVAREKDIARPRLFKDKQLVMIAERQPGNIQQLKNIPEMHPASLSRYGHQILDLVEASRDVEHADFPPRIQPPLRKEAAGLFRQARDFLEREADQAGIPPALLYRKKELELMINDGFYSGEFRLPAMFEGWRAPVGEQLLSLLDQNTSAQSQEENA